MTTHAYPPTADAIYPTADWRGGTLSRTIPARRRPGYARMTAALVACAIVAWVLIGVMI